jgi:outer membrane receptor protein involved in Fe transport
VIFIHEFNVFSSKDGINFNRFLTAFNRKKYRKLRDSPRRSLHGGQMVEMTIKTRIPALPMSLFLPAHRRSRLLLPGLITVLLLPAYSPGADTQQAAPQAEAKPGTRAVATTAPLEEVVIFARGEELIGTADAASEGAVGGADLSVRPLLRVAELLEVVPGLIAAQHSGSGKANQYFLRGIQLDHGTDFTSLVDGMPWNFRTHGHGQGYLDVNGLIPEAVERIDYRKGPYRADSGDFALAGASLLHTVDVLEHPFVAAEGGAYGWGRLAGGGSVNLGPGQLTAIGQWKTYDGPWQLPENLQHESLWSKYHAMLDAGTLTATLSGYRATWHPTEQAPEASIGTSACANAYCTLDLHGFGLTDRWIGTLQLTRDNSEASVYAQYYNWHMLSNPTYDFQINQFDRRWTAGGRYERTLVRTATTSLKVGISAQHDNIAHVGYDHYVQGAFADNVSDNAVRESSTGVYVEGSWSPLAPLRLNAGLRADGYRFAVDALNPTSAAGTRDDHQFSPKLGVAWKLAEHLELYGNWGRGFHSNDARGVVNPVTPVPGLVAGTGYEAGARFEQGSFRLTGAYWWLNVASELIFVGDANAVQPKAGAQRHGFELVAFWKPIEGVGIDAVYTGSAARYQDIQQDPAYDPVSAPTLQGYDVQGSMHSAGELGVSMVRARWEASARLRYLGPYPLVPSGTQNAAGETMINLRGAWKPGRYTVYAELLNVFNDHGNDIVYYYDTFVPGVSAPGTEQASRLSRAVEPRTLRFGIKVEF